MQSFVCFITIAVLAAVVSSASVGSSQQSAPQNILETLNAESNLNAPSELTRLKKSAYGGSSSYPAPPCPKNYLFSCQPNVAQVPCAPAPASGGYAGAYSAPVPTYSMPQIAHPGIPQELLRPVYNYNQYLY